MIRTDILVIGGGAAGMAAALSAYEMGASVILAETQDKLGGILNRCTHHGFGLGYFGEDLTGTEYASRYLKKIEALPLRILTGTTVLEVRKNRTALISSRFIPSADQESYTPSAHGGIEEVSFSVLVLASGSYERPHEYAMTAGSRPAGVMTAGTAQGLINEGGLDIGSRIVILGSGNVGQIMAGQLADAGKEIVAMIEQNDAPGGLARNVHEYIEGRCIPLILNSTVTKIHGRSRISGVTARSLLSGEETFLACDTLITALGLIPDTALVDHLRDGGQLPSWILTAGNCSRIFDFADAVTTDGEQAGKRAAHLALSYN